jgi:NADH:ubiquinone oxidoreductase subunit 4 (subunit M)
MFGTISNKRIEDTYDLDAYEVFGYALLLIAVIALGIFPNLVNSTIEPFMNNIIDILYVK